MRILTCLLILLALSACKEENAEKYPVYPIDLDRPDTVKPSDLFRKVVAVPLQTTEKSHFIMGELGAKGDRYFILDRNRQLFFCFDTTGKFRYVVDNKPKDPSKAYNPQLRSILNPYTYYYKKTWYYYLTFRNFVYTKDKEGNQNIAYMWDFGKYNDDKEMVVRFPQMDRQVVIAMQKEWMQQVAHFALTEGRQNREYIYTRVERFYKDTASEERARFFHLFCHKATRKCYYFSELAGGIPLAHQVRLEEGHVLMLLPWWEKEKYVQLDILDERSREIIRDLKETDNPVMLKWYLK